MNSDTPRTDKAILGQFDSPFLQYVNINFARQLERELTAAKAQVVELYQAAKEYAGATTDCCMGGEATGELCKLHQILERFRHE